MAKHDPLPPDHLLHGTAGAYTNHKCRCDDCREANSEARRRYRQKQRCSYLGCGKHYITSTGGFYFCRTHENWAFEQARAARRIPQEVTV